MPHEPRRVVLFTSSNINEPRGVKHAALVARMLPHADVELIDMAPMGSEIPTPQRLHGIANVRRFTCFTPHRKAALVRTAVARGMTKLARIAFARTGRASVFAISPNSRQLCAFVLKRPPADLYIGHNVDALPALGYLRAKLRVPVVFDSMEYYADMGLSALEGEIIRNVERRYLPSCSLVLTSSEDLSEALARTYGIDRCLALYNAPPTGEPSAVAKPPGLALYWRNTVIGLGSRGLEDALSALTQVPDDVTLQLQGGDTTATDDVRAKVRVLGLGSRVTFHGAYAPHEAVAQASRFHVGLCLERDSCENHRVTVSNKLFDYFMAGLSVIASDLPGLRRVVNRSGAGLLYPPGDVDALAAHIRRLRDDVTTLRALSQRAREFALREGNEEHELAKLAARLRVLLGHPA